MPTFEPGHVTSAPPTPDDDWFLFTTDSLLVDERGPVKPAVLPADSHFLGTLDGRRCFTARVELEHAPPGSRPEGLRNVYTLLGEPRWGIAGRALQVLEWARTHRHCGACGRKTRAVPGER